VLGVKKLLITVVCLMGATQSLYAEEVLYCTSELATGFYREDGVWKQGKFVGKRFTVKFENEYSKLNGLDEDHVWNCRRPFKHDVISTAVTCQSSNYRSSDVFIYSPKTMRFLLFVSSIAGYIGKWVDADTDSLYAGTCQNF